jgi:putative two-component system response regulator
MLERILRAGGYHPVLAANGNEALARLASDIDLVLTDVTMPGMDGFEVVRRIREHAQCHDVPVIMVTGMSSKSDRLRAVECGANDFIGKPYERTEVEIRVRAQLMFKDMKDALKRHNEELEVIVQRRTGELQAAFQRASAAERETYEAHVDTISRLAAAAEYKDEDTGTHIVRIGRYCSVLARGLGLPDAEVHLLERSSVLHDVGKIGIPDAVLLKPGKLTREEFDVMKQHTVIGAKILEGSVSELIEAGRVIALTHHEKWDGSGYPRGIAGEEIPLWGRICAVADVFDALTSERPYKLAFSNEKALAIINEDSGTHFDPQIVEVFLANWETILQIQNEARAALRTRDGVLAGVNLGSLLADALERVSCSRAPGA